MAERVPQLPEKIEIEPSWYESRDEILSQSKTIARKIEGNKDWETAEWYLTKITKTEKELEKQRKALDKPFRDVTKRIKQVADEAVKGLQQRKAELKRSMADYQKAIAEQRQKEIEDKAQEAKGNPFAQEVAKSTGPETQEPKSTMTRKVQVKKFKVVNSNQVPREYCQPDDKLIREAVQKRGVTEIPGVDVWEETEIRSR